MEGGRSGDLPTRGPNAGPAPEDVDGSQVYTRKEACEAKSKKVRELHPTKNTTAYQYSTTGMKWFRNFCEYQNWTVEEGLVFIWPTTKVIRDGVFRQLFRWMHSYPGMTKSPFKTMLQWAQQELQHQGDKLKVSVPKAYVVNIPGVGALKTEIYSKQRTSRMELQEDLQAYVASEIGDEKMLAMCKDCLHMAVPGNPLIPFQTYYELRQTHQVPFAQPRPAAALTTAPPHNAYTLH